METAFCVLYFMIGCCIMAMIICTCMLLYSKRNYFDNLSALVNQVAVSFEDY